MPKIPAELAIRQPPIWLGMARTPLRQESQQKQMKVCLINTTFRFPVLITRLFYLNDLLATGDQTDTLMLKHLPAHTNASLGQGCQLP